MWYLWREGVCGRVKARSRDDAETTAGVQENDDGSNHRYGLGNGENAFSLLPPISRIASGMEYAFQHTGLVAK